MFKLAKGGVGVAVMVAVAVLVGVRVGKGQRGRTVALGSIVMVGVRVRVGGKGVAVAGSGVIVGCTTGVSLAPPGINTGRVSLGCKSAIVIVVVAACGNAVSPAEGSGALD